MAIAFIQVFFFRHSHTGQRDTMTAVAAPLFLGINIPWHWFGYDIGGGAFDEGWFDGFFASVSGITWPAHAVRSGVE